MANPSPPAAPWSAGTTWPGLTVVRGEVARVEAVDRGGAAAVARMLPGDVLVQVGDVTRPSAREALAALSAVPAGGRLVIAVDRAGAPHVVALERPRETPRSPAESRSELGRDVIDSQLGAGPAATSTS